MMRVMDSVHSCSYARVAGLALALLALLSTCSSCGLDPVDRRIAENIARLETDTTLRPVFDLEKVGVRAVPALCATLKDKTVRPGTAFWVISILEHIGDERALPALVGLADRFQTVEPTKEVLVDCERWDYLALRAREAVALIVDPANRRRFGPYAVAIITPNGEPDIECIEIQAAYFAKVNAWYREWRVHCCLGGCSGP
jgi:hypothetical protein